MKASVLLVPALLLTLLSASASDVIDLGRRPASFKDLQGREYNALLLKADLDGVIYVENGTTGGGRISYTNLAPATLESWGVPTNRISAASDRISAKAKMDAQARTLQAEQARTAAKERAAALANLQAVAVLRVDTPDGLDGEEIDGVVENLTTRKIRVWIDCACIREDVNLTESHFHIDVRPLEKKAIGQYMGRESRGSTIKILRNESAAYLDDETTEEARHPVKIQWLDQ